ncbi:MAG: FAD-dependent oxidoreductase [Gemmatimonadota bacterium]
MDRRHFLASSGASLAGVSLGLQGTPRPARAQTSNSSDVLVIGAGTFGVWTAYHLSRLGASVTLVDAYGPGNSRASSGGETRQMQADTRSDLYTRSSIDSYGWWKRLERESGISIVLETGKVDLSLSAEDRDVGEEVAGRHQRFGIEGTEILEPDEVRYRWPQMHSDDASWGIYSEGAAGCVMMARKGVAVVAEQLQQQGGQVRTSHVRPRLTSTGAVEGVTTQDGETLSAGHYVFACGPWLSTLFPDLLGPRLQVQRRDVLFFGSPPGDSRFAYPHMPTWFVRGSGFYGFPDIEARGFKVAPYPDYNVIDPDVDERLIMPHQVRRGRQFLAHRFPGLADMPISETRVCQVTNTSDRDFMADVHPESDNVWIVGGGSGHGFKHGPAVGEHLANRIIGGEVRDDYLEAFTVLKDEFA